MKRRSKNVLVFILAAFFAFGVLCSTLAAPGQALASVSGCSQMPGAMAMEGCEQPIYLCGFDFANHPLSRGALSSARSSDLLKNALGLAVVIASAEGSIGLTSPGARDWKNVSLAEPGKVSLRLFNSVLNL